MEKGMEVGMRIYHLPTPPSKHSSKNYGALHEVGQLGVRRKKKCEERRGLSAEKQDPPTSDPPICSPRVEEEETSRPTKNKCEETRRLSAEKQDPPTSDPPRTNVRKDAYRVRRNKTHQPATHQEQETMDNEAESDIEKSTSKGPIIKKTRNNGYMKYSDDRAIRQRRRTVGKYNQSLPKSCRTQHWAFGNRRRNNRNTTIYVILKHDNLHRIGTQQFTSGNRMEEDPPTRSQEIEIAFSATSTSDKEEEESSVLLSAASTSEGEEEEEEESSVLTSSSSSTSASESDNGGDDMIDTKKKYRHKMVVYTDSQVPKLDKGDEGKFEDWYTQFQAYADKHKYGDMLSTKAHKDLPLEGQITPREDMSKAQKKAFKHHNTALNDLYKAFSDNSTGLAIMEKSKIDQGGSAETNARLRTQWPRDRVHRVIEELMREYRRKNRSHDREQLNIDLKSLKLATGAPPQALIEDTYDLQ
eukprot:jgi/Psemu1/43248/gm1.43248_g